MPMVKIRTRVLPASVSSRAALAMISIRFLAALLMFQIWLGYRPAVSRRRPRVELCGTPLTVSVLVCSGNVVGMPALRWKLCLLVGGIHSAHPGTVEPSAGLV